MVEVHVEGGTLDAALANGNAFLATNPEAAAMQAQAILRRDPDNILSLRLLAKALRKLGNDSEAEKAELASIHASRHDPVLHAATQAIFANSDNPKAALERKLTGDPENAVAHCLLGEIGLRSGHFGNSETHLRIAIGLVPAYPEPHSILARLYYNQFRCREALETLNSGMYHIADTVSWQRFCATLYSETGQYEKAIAIYERLLQQHDQEIAFWISYGDALRSKGRSEDADAAYRKAKDIDPKYGRSWWSIASLKHRKIDSEDVADMRDALPSQSSDPDSSLHLHFAVATALDQAGNYAQAFQHFAIGNRLRRQELPYKAKQVSASVDATITNQESSFFEGRKDWGQQSNAPIFIVGMPRSGSTLLEQILSSHPLIEGTSELPIIPALIRQAKAETNVGVDASTAELLCRLDAKHCSEMGAAYLARALDRRRTDRPMFIDKLPHNWQEIAFIRLILPNAKIIDVRRNPMDCCFSNFKLLFAPGHPASYDLHEIALYYRDYVRMMSHLNTALPAGIHTVIYEDLVDDVEESCRAVLAYMNLDFDPACLDFQKTTRSVTTASSEQVRRPINRDGIGTWQNYRQWLNPLIEGLGDLPQIYSTV